MNNESEAAQQLQRQIAVLEQDLKRLRPIAVDLSKSKDPYWTSVGEQLWAMLDRHGLK